MFKLFRSETLFLGLLSLGGYVSAFLFSLGYSGYFNLPSLLVTIDPLKMLGLSLLFAGLLAAAILCLSGLVLAFAFLQHSTLRWMAPVAIYGLFWTLSLTFLGYKHLSIAVEGFIIQLTYLAILLTALYFSYKSLGRLSERLGIDPPKMFAPSKDRPLELVEVRGIFSKIFKFDRMIVFTPLVLATFFGSVFLTGYIYAARQVDFFSLKSDASSILIAKYGNKLVFGHVQGNRLGNVYTILNEDSSSSIIYNRVKIPDLVVAHTDNLFLNP